MTLISCPECKTKISDKSEHCIECGAPQHVILGNVKEKIGSEQKEYKVEIDNSESQKVNNTNIFKRFFNLEKKQIYLICFILWPLTFAFGITINDYMLELTYGNVNQFGKIPGDSVMKGIMAGLFSGGILLGVSYFIYNLFFLFINSSKFTTPKIFLAITILWTAFTIYAYGGRFIKVLNLEKENIEYFNEEIKKLLK